MENEPVHSSDVAFTPAVKAVQNRRGSRRAYTKHEERGGWKTVIDADLKRFIEAQTSAFLATASGEGQPYIQHRGGPAGFLKVIDESTIGFVDFTGNRQYITTGNLAENPKANLFPIDFAERRHQDLGLRPRGRGERGTDHPADADRLQGTRGADHTVCSYRVGRELCTAHSVALRGRGCHLRHRPTGTAV